MAFRGFLGDYKITVQLPSGKNIEAAFVLKKKDGQDVTRIVVDVGLRDVERNSRIKRSTSHDAVWISDLVLVGELLAGDSSRAVGGGTGRGWNNQ